MHMTIEASSGLRPVASLAEFFRDALQQAMQRQHLAVADHTEHYLVSLLTLFARSEALFEPTEAGPRLRPLALLLADAVNAPDAVGRERALQRLGDVSLFVAGFCAHSFARRLVDVDYHIAMGGRAYGSLSGMGRHTARGRALSLVFAELALKFQRLVDALNEIADQARAPSDAEILRLYEIWVKSGSARARGRLRELGVAPVPVDLRRAH
jgi:hypothetical protein